MLNDVKLQESHPVDENIRPLKVGGVATAIETANSGNGAVIAGDLEVKGDLSINGNLADIRQTGGLSIFTTGTGADITLRPGYQSTGASTVEVIPTQHFIIATGGDQTIVFDNGGTGIIKMKFTSIWDNASYFELTENRYGVTTFTTADEEGTAGADMIFNVDGYIDFNSATNEDITLDSGGDIILVPDGDTTIDRNTALTATGTAKGLHIDYDHTGISASGQTVTGIGLDLDMNCDSPTHVGTVVQTGIDIDLVAADDGTQTNAGIDITTSGADKNFGLKINNEDNTTTNGTEADFINYSSADTADYFYMNTYTNGATQLGTINGSGADADLKLAPNGCLQIHINAGANPNAEFDLVTDYSRFRIWGYNQSADYFNIDVEADGQTTISTVDAAGADAHLNIEPDGHVEFDGCAVGFDKLAGVFSTSGVIGDANDSTDIDFRLSNKYELELTDIIAGTATSEFLNLIFPAVSGNFILVISQDGTGSRTIHPSAYVAYQSDGSTKATNAAFADGTDGNLRWAGGTAPTLTTTADKADIVAIYWDADNQTAFAVMSKNF